MKLRRVLCFFTVFASLSTALPAFADIALPPPPQFSGKSYVLMDFNSGQLLADQEATRHIEPASITKLMTAYITFSELKSGRLHLNDEINISETAWKTGGSRMFVQVGTKVKLEDLIRGMIIQSGNDATVAVAEAIAGSVPTFANVMNQYAAKLGMKDSHFTNADGLPDPQHYTSALDLAILARAIIRDYPEYYKYYSELEFTYNNITQHNRNKLLGTEPGVDGMKTGHTDSAGYCMVASGMRSGMRLISVVIGLDSDKTRTAASRELLNYGFRFFETTPLYDATHPVDKVKVWKGGGDMLPIGVAQPLYVTTPRGQRSNLAIQAQVQQKVTAPLAAGSPLGSIQISLGGVPIRKETLVALRDAPLGSWWRRIVDSVRLRIGH